MTPEFSNSSLDEPARWIPAPTGCGFEYEKPQLQWDLSLVKMSPDIPVEFVWDKR